MNTERFLFSFVVVVAFLFLLFGFIYLFCFLLDIASKYSNRINSVGWFQVLVFVNKYCAAE